jgi:hypothetical protein
VAAHFAPPAIFCFTMANLLDTLKLIAFVGLESKFCPGLHPGLQMWGASVVGMAFVPVQGVYWLGAEHRRTTASFFPFRVLYPLSPSHNRSTQKACQNQGAKKPQMSVGCGYRVRSGVFSPMP